VKTLKLTLAFLISALASSAYAETDKIYTSWKNNEAVGGYDVVSFYSGKPLEGKSEFTTSHLGVDWRFSSRANLDLFKTNPEAFIPQYGGYCAWAVAKKKLAKGSPEHWHIRDGRLYLNFNARIQEKWEKDVPGFIEDADDNWQSLIEDKTDN